MNNSKVKRKKKKDIFLFVQKKIVGTSQWKCGRMLVNVDGRIAHACKYDRIRAYIAHSKKRKKKNHIHGYEFRYNFIEIYVFWQKPISINFIK